MQNLYSNILQAKKDNRKLLAILIDPEKVSIEQVVVLSEKIKASPATHIFVGGSTFSGTYLDELIATLKKETQLPILIFPGHPSQISNEADGILFLSLLSGRNPEYLIEHHINSVEALEKFARKREPRCMGYGASMEFGTQYQKYFGKPVTVYDNFVLIGNTVVPKVATQKTFIKYTPEQVEDIVKVIITLK